MIQRVVRIPKIIKFMKIEPIALVLEKNQISGIARLNQYSIVVISEIPNKLFTNKF
jgi:hypothetical protein|tara:strand:- start:936 stop:1103 length:168 start_codon:yes stop_codon:yes gene_type:complete